MGSEFAQNYERALSGYSGNAGQINNNLAAWRSDVDMTRQANKTGLAAATSQASNKVDMDAIKGVADEFGLQGGKKLFTKYITKGVLDSKFGGLVKRSANDVDKELGDRFRSAIKSKLGIGESQDSVGSEGTGTFEDFIKKNLGGSTDEATERLNNLRSMGETKISDGTELTRQLQNEPRLKTGADLGDVELQPTDDLTNSNSLLPSDPYGREAVRSSRPTERIRSSSEMEESKVDSAPADEPIESRVFSDRVATPEGGSNVPSLDELQNRFNRITKPRARGGSVEMENLGEVKEPTRQAGDYDEFEGMDFGEFKGQGSRDLPSSNFDFANDASMRPDALGNTSLNNQVGIRNAASDAEAAGQDAIDSARSGIAGASRAGEDMMGNARSALSRLSSGAQDGLNVGQQALADGTEGLGSGLADLAKTAGGSALKSGGEEAVGGGLEAAGALLDATPFAPLGALFGLIGGALDAGAAYQAVKGVGDWVNDDILGHHPAVNFNRSKIPTNAALPKSFSITPTMDSVMDTGAGGGSW
jgi:hypothetical protein